MLRSAFFALWLVAFAHANMCGIEGGCEEQPDAESMKVSMLQRGTLHKETTSQRMYEEILAKRKAAIVSELSAIETQLGEGPGGSGYNPGGGGGSGYNPGNTCFDERSDRHCPTGAGATYVDGKCCLPGPHTCFEEFKLGCPAPALFVGFIHGQCCVPGANLDCPKVWRSDCADDDIFVGTVKGNCCPGDHGGSGFNPGNGGNGGSGFNPGNGGNGGSGYNPGTDGNGGSGYNPGNSGNGGSGYNPGNGGNGGSGYNPGNGGNGGSGYNPGNGGTGGSGYNPGDTAACDAHPACARLQLEGNCCPNADGVRLGCCS